MSRRGWGVASLLPLLKNRGTAEATYPLGNSEGVFVASPLVEA